MTIVKLNKRNYVRSLHGRGIHGRYSKVIMQHGYGIVENLGKNASKLVLGGIGKSTGSYFGKIREDDSTKDRIRNVRINCKSWFIIIRRFSRREIRINNW